MKLTTVLLSFFLLITQKINASIEHNQQVNYGTISVRTYGAIPDDGTDDTQAIRQAIAAAIATNLPQIVLFEAGRYDLIAAGNNNYYVRLLNANNIILRGATINNQPATRLVRFNSGVENAVLPFLLQIRFSTNIGIENLVLDNDPYYYTAGVVTAKSGSNVTVDILPGHPMNIVKPYIMGVYDNVAKKNKALRVTWDTGLPTWTPIAGGSGRLMRLNFQDLADTVNIGESVFWFQGNHGGTQTVTGKSKNISFKNVITNNSTGFVYHFVDNENITLEKVKIEPTGNRVAVSPRDGIHLAHCSGIVSLDSVIVKNVPGDDGLNVHGLYTAVGSIAGKTIVFSENLVADLKPNTRIQFFDNDYQPVWTGTIESSNPTTVNNGPVTVVLKETPPNWIVAGTVASPLGWLPKSFIIKNSTFENTGRFGITAKTINVVIDSCSFKFNGLAGIHTGSSFNSFFKEAQHAWNVVIKNSSFENNIRRMSDNTPGGVVVDQLSVDNPNINGNLYLYNNTFKDELYAYNLRDAMNIRLWGNVYNNVTTPIWRNTPTTSNFTQSIVFNDYVTDDLAKAAILYNETWPTSSNPQDSVGTVSWNNNAGAYAEFHFVGNHISYFARRGSQMGMVDVYLDDVLVVDNFDLYSNAVQTKSLIYSNSSLQNTTHTLRIVNTGLKNPSSTNFYVNIDFLMHRMGNFISTPNVLPVQLLNFEAQKQGQKVVLQWQTANEVNNSHFEILRSNSNNVFTNIGKVNASTSSGILHNYSFTDAQPKSGTNYYQLKQYDLDGQSTLSSVVTVNFSDKTSFSLYPNPVKINQPIHIKFNAAESISSVQIIDMNQKVVLQQSNIGQASNLQLATHLLQPGVYILKINTVSNQFVNKLIVTQ
jgi:Secretion system C-terminal sorting domain/Pectate lyase superfamily protein